ncbi:MAG: DUF1343 domain-containing protein [Bacteroidetes bacterium]|nr:DUF1343 domain-containing protein [Bacteroidota bacterium]
MRRWIVGLGVWLLLVLPTASGQVRSGADVLLGDSLHLLHGRRIGLMANHTSRLSDGRMLFDSLRSLPGVTVAALFSPEHGFRGTAADGVAIGSDTVAGVPLHSLYGATRRPTPDMLAGLDVLVMDLQDIGVRYYTYLSTMAMCLEAAAEAGLPVLLCDRPNPLGGLIIEGPIRNDSLRSFVGYLPLPVRHGLTAGEAMRMAVGEGWLADSAAPRLTVLPCAGWKRNMYHDDTGLPWINPSPNMRSPDAALAYVGTCLLEGTNLNEGRGTEEPFLRFGAPFIDGDTLASMLNALELRGVRFHALRYRPIPMPGAPNPRFSGRVCGGVRLEITNRHCYESFRTGLEIIAVLRRQHDAFLSFRSYLDLLSGIRGTKDRSVFDLLDRADADRRDFLPLRAPYLLYP